MAPEDSFSFSEDQLGCVDLKSCFNELILLSIAGKCFSIRKKASFGAEGGVCLLARTDAPPCVSGSAAVSASLEALVDRVPLVTADSSSSTGH